MPPALAGEAGKASGFFGSGFFGGGFPAGGDTTLGFSAASAATAVGPAGVPVRLPALEAGVGDGLDGAARAKSDEGASLASAAVASLLDGAGANGLASDVDEPRAAHRPP